MLILQHCGPELESIQVQITMEEGECKQKVSRQKIEAGRADFCGAVRGALIC